MNPNNWFTVWTFIIIATLLSIGFGNLVKNNRLPFKSSMAFSDRQRKFIQVWAKIALIIGVIIPIIMAIAFWEQPVLRQFFSYYLVAIAVQLSSEISFSRILCKSVVVVIGTLYTGFRIWQLWAGLPLMPDSQPWLSLFWLVGLFWVANLIMLFTLAIPSILPELTINDQSTERSADL